MASARMPEEFVEIVSHHLPPEGPVGPKGGRPRVGHRIALRVIWFVLTTGARREDVPPGLGCSGRAAHRRPRAWEEAGIRDRLRADLLRPLREADKLDPDAAIIDGVTLRAFGGGEATGPSPVDRSREGTKPTLLVDRRGVPLAIRTAGANASDHRRFIPLILDSPEVGASRGGPRSCPTRRPPIGGPTAGGRGGCCGGRGSSRTSPSGGRRTAAGWGRSAGWWSGRSAGSRGCDGCGCGTTGWVGSSTPGRRSPPV